MKDRNVSTYSLDVRGFGGWANNQKKALSFDETSEDITALIKSIRRDHPGKPGFPDWRIYGRRHCVELFRTTQRPG